MACTLPQSPTPLLGRRLFELLEEPQEPFLLDAYPLEKGHSPKLLPFIYKRLQNWIQMQLKSISSWVEKAPFDAGFSMELTAEPRKVHGSGIEESISPRVFELFNELFELAYTPAFYNLLGSPTCKFDQTHKFKRSDNCEPLAEKKLHESTHEEVIREMTAKEVSSSRRAWSGLKQVRQVGDEVEDKIFEEIKEEMIIELISSYCKFNRSSSSF